MAAYSGFPEEEFDTVFIILDKMDKIGLDGVAQELEKEGYSKESVQKYLALFTGVEQAKNGIKYLAETLEGFLEPDVEQNLSEIVNSVEAAKTADFMMVFDPTLVRGMSYYTGTIFEISMPELGAACGGGGRYDKMVGKFTGNDVPACGFSIGFERIVLLLMESGFTVPMQRPKVAYLIEKGYPADKLTKVIAKAQEERVAGKQVLVVRMNKNKKFQKEKLAADGYKDILEFYNN
jgi:histidyl-tRNA synthetase